MDECDLNRRRESLRVLLSEEAVRFKQIASEGEETVDERIQAARQRIHELKTKREDTRRAYVHDKLMIQFLNQSDDMRTIHSKNLTMKVS